MKKVSLRFGRYKDVTESGEDGATILFPFSMVDSSMVGTSAELQVATWHRLRVSVAGGINWGNDEVSLVKALFAVGKQEIVRKLYLQGDLSELETAFIPHGDCPVNFEMLSDPNGTIVEVKIP